MYEMFRRQEYKPIGPRSEDYDPARIKNNAPDVLKCAKSLEELKAVLWESLGPAIRAQAWRYLFRYIPLNSQNEGQILLKKRLEYQEYVEMNTEERFTASNDIEVLDTIKLIRKDIHRTLPTSAVFRSQPVQDCLTRILLIYSIR